MKKILLCLLSIICFMGVSINVNALSANVDVSCPSAATSLEEVSCTVYINAKDFKLKGIQLFYTVDNGNFIKFKNSSSVRSYTINNKGAILEVINPNSGKVEVGTIKIEMPTNDKMSLKLYDIIVTDDGDNSNIKSLDITDKSVSVRVKSNINTLKSLKVKEGNYITDYDSDKTSYSFDYDKDKITIEGSLTDSSSKVTGFKTYNLNYGINNINIVVTSESGNIRTYKISVNRLDVRDKTNTLDSLVVSDYKLSPEFNKNTKSYKVTVPTTTDKINISSTLSSSKSSYVSGFGNRTVNLKYGKNTILIKVKSESESIKTYEIIVTREDNRSSNNYLKNLNISNGEFKFDKKVNEYAVTVKNEVENINVTGEVEDSKSKVTGLGNYKLKEGINNITIKVTAETGSVRTYTLKVTRIVKNNTVIPNNNLKSLTINNYQINFDKNVVLYNITIEDEKSLEFNYETESADSSVVINGNENLKNGSVITVKVTAIDGSTKEYKFNISKNEEIKKDEPIVPHEKVQISKTRIIKLVVACISIVIIIISVIILGIINVLKKKASLWK